MTYSSSIIFDQNIEGGRVYISRAFTNARFLLLDTPSLPQEEAYEIGASLNVNIPLIGRTISKNYPILSENIVGVSDTFYLVPIPVELSDSQYDMQLVLGVGSNLGSFPLRVYAYSNDTTLNTIEEELEEILARLSTIREGQIIDLAEDVATSVNDVQNNVALAALASSLSPITLGASLSTLPPLGIGTTALTGTLLPGL